MNEITKTQPNMKTYNLLYKCLICNRLTRWPETVQLTYDMLPEFLGKFVQHQQFFGNLHLHKIPDRVPCKCKDGNAGLACFAGLKEA